MASENRSYAKNSQEADLLRGWESASQHPEPNTSKRNDDNRGISRKTFNRSEMLRIQRQWECSEHQTMRDEPAYLNSLEGYGVISTVGRLWSRYRTRVQQDELRRQVEEQTYLLQLEAQRLRKEEEIEKFRNESLSRSMDDEEDNITDGAPKRYREALKAAKIQSELAASGKGPAIDIDISEPTPTATGIGMAVQFKIPTDSQRYPNESHNEIIGEAAEEMITEVAIQKEEDSNYPVTPYILSKEVMKKIACQALPVSLLFNKWKRIYSLVRDGDSFYTMLRHVKGHEKTLLVIRSVKGEIFGGFADTQWEVQHYRKVGGGFYGGGQSVLYSVIEKEGTGTEPKQEDVIVYKWTGANRFCQICDHDKKMLAMGGGGEDGAFGLCVVDDFNRGSTGKCATFANESLLRDGGEDFDILDVEIWGFVAGL